jgi:hypothetical protein
VNNSAEERTI